jgi:formate dehydrogenase maturation protein FdhE
MTIWEWPAQDFLLALLESDLLPKQESRRRCERCGVNPVRGLVKRCHACDKAHDRERRSRAGKCSVCSAPVGYRVVRCRSCYKAKVSK